MLRLQDLRFRRLEGEEGRPIGGTSYANVVDIAAGRSIVIHFYRSFAREIGFKSVYNGFFDRMEVFPNYPQLGCSGFVIADPAGKIVEPRTPAFLQYRQAAFAWMVGRLHGLPSAPNVIQVRIRSRGPRGTTHLVKAILLNMDMGKKEAEVLVNGMVTRVPVGLIEDEEDEDEDEDEGGAQEQEHKAQAPETETPAVEPAVAELGAVNDQELAELLNYTSVGVGSMDRGHDSCAAALRELASTRRIPAMQALQAELKEHFEEEEALFVKFKFGGPNGEATAHRADHERILGLIASALDQAGSGGGGDVLFSSSFIRYLASRLKDHIHDFDSLYTDIVKDDAQGAEHSA